METITLSEFLNVTKLTERELLRMLELGELKTVCGESSELLIDISELTPERIAQRTPDSQADGSSEELEQEIVASEILSALDEIIDESLELALKWQSEKADGRSPESE